MGGIFGTLNDGYGKLSAHKGHSLYIWFKHMELVNKVTEN